MIVLISGVEFRIHQDVGVKSDRIAGRIVTYRDLFCPCEAGVDVACVGHMWAMGHVFDMPTLD